MKKLLLLLLLSNVLGAYCLKAQMSYYPISVINPRTWSSGVEGEVKQLEIDVSPRGAYFLCDYTFTLGLANSTPGQDSLEIAMYFSLPKNAAVIDSWLWLDATTIIRADLLDRSQAVTVYEDIVRRRKDPSILLKNSETNYELRIFPLVAPYTGRKVKLTVLMPAFIHNGYSTLNTPADLINNLSASAIVTFRFHNTTTQSFNQIPDFALSNYISNQNSQLTEGGIPRSVLTNAEPLQIRYAFTHPDSFYVSTYSNQNEHYYQVIADAGKFKTATPRKVAIAMEDFYNNSATDRNRLAEALRRLLLSLTPADSFNVFYSYNNTLSLASASSWLPCSSQAINTAINQVVSNTDNSQANTHKLLSAVKRFRPNLSKPTDIIFCSNESLSENAATQKIGRVDSAIDPTIPIWSVNYATTYLNYSGTGCKPPGETFFNYLSNISQGMTFSPEQNFRSYYCYNTGSFPAIVNDISSFLGQRFDLFNVYLDNSTNIPLNEYTLAGSATMHPGGQTFIKTGKFAGNSPAQFNLGIMDAGSISITPILATQNIGDSTLAQYCAAAEIRTFEFVTSGISYAAQTSLKHRVLSAPTAFLALENGDTIGSTNPRPTTTVGLDKQPETNPSQALVSIYPNPFTTDITIELKALQPGRADITLTLYDMMGKKVWQKTIAAGNQQSSIKLSPAENGPLPPGIYILEIQSGGQQQRLKLTHL